MVHATGLRLSYLKVVYNCNNCHHAPAAPRSEDPSSVLARCTSRHQGCQCHKTPSKKTPLNHGLTVLSKSALPLRLTRQVGMGLDDTGSSGRSISNWVQLNTDWE
eukprot:4914762-Pleurochrysis_carterae.AAC.2